MLQVEGLSKRYGDRLAVNAISFAIAAGETVGLLGPIGAGKTTAIAMISGIVRPDPPGCGAGVRGARRGQLAWLHWGGYCLLSAQRRLRPHVGHARPQCARHARLRDHGDAAAGDDWRRLGARLRVPAMAAECVAMCPRAGPSTAWTAPRGAACPSTRRCRPSSCWLAGRGLPGRRDLAFSLGGMIPVPVHRTR